PSLRDGRRRAPRNRSVKFTRGVSLWSTHAGPLRVRVFPDLDGDDRPRDPLSTALPRRWRNVEAIGTRRACEGHPSAGSRSVEAAAAQKMAKLAEPWSG